MKREITSKHIDGIADLVIWAPIKKGFIHAFENVAYDTRLRIVGEALHKIRVSAREHEKVEPFADTAKRILTLLDFRIGISDEDLSLTKFIETKSLKREGEEGNVCQQPARVDIKDYRAEIEPRKFLYLTATFDGAFEPYMRLIWKPLGPFLDLLFCNCEGYVPASENSFPTYLKWVREHQMDAAIFYSATGTTIRDQLYLNKLEKLQRGVLDYPDNTQCPALDIDLNIAKMTLDDPEQLAEQFRKNPCNALETNRLALEALTVLFKLADFHPPDQLRPETKCEAISRGNDKGDDPHPGDGRFLLRATQALLKGWDEKIVYGDPILGPIYREPIDWFREDTTSVPPPDPKAFDEKCERRNDADRASANSGEKTPAETEPCLNRKDVQKGLLTPYDEPGRPVGVGTLLLFQIVNPEKARATLCELSTNSISWEGEESAPEDPFLNIGFTYSGLERLGMPEDELMALPKEFREGMEDRAGLIGDVHDHHPRRWRLPDRNWPKPNGETLSRPPVELSEVDFILRLHWPLDQSPDENEGFVDFLGGAEQLFAPAKHDAETASDKAAALDRSNLMHFFEGVFAKIIRLGSDPEESGIQLVAIESLAKRDKANGEPPPVDGHRGHFGFRDGLSQPEFVLPEECDGEDGVKPNEAHQNNMNGSYDPSNKLGELLLGYTNDRDDPPPPRCKSPESDPETEPDPCVVPQPEPPCLPEHFANSSFLIIRKIEQDVDAFNRLLIKARRQYGLKREETAAHLMGRDFDGKPLIGPGDNGFTYGGDLEGTACPFAAHIRRSNPRSAFQDRRDPQILRRGLSYKDFRRGTRGSMFMAYNASIAEQFEVIQRWINGGNSTDIASSHNDPLIGVPPLDPETKVFRFIRKGSQCDDEVVRLKIPKPLTTLQWGVYLFVPSKAALRKIADDTHSQQGLEHTRRRSLEKGEDIISKIEALPEEAQRLWWKALLEDFFTKDPAEKSQSPDVWRAIRRGQDGVYRLPHKVLRQPASTNSGKRLQALQELIANLFEDGKLKRELAGRTITELFPKHLPTDDEDMDVEEDDREDSEDSAREKQNLVLVADQDLILKVLGDHKRFSVDQEYGQRDRVKKSFGDIFVAQDPKDRNDPNDTYFKESEETNAIIYDYSSSDKGQEAVFGLSYQIAKAVLDEAKAIAYDLSQRSGKPPFFKLELRRQFIQPVLGLLCQKWFDIPDVDGAHKRGKNIELGGWGWAPVSKDQPGTSTMPIRKPRCPGDFLAPSRYAFYPRPTRTIRQYGVHHGRAIGAAAKCIVEERKGRGFSGVISQQMDGEIEDSDLLARNLIGIMEGMLPPTDGLLRGILFEWLTEKKLWQHQAALHRVTGYQRPEYAQAKSVLKMPIKEAICKRPSPDLIYRIATQDTTLGTKCIEKGDMVILGLVSATLDSLDRDAPDITTVFGGNRTCPTQEDGDPMHACPAQEMVLAMVTGILAALLDSARIQAQPASLIVKFSDFEDPRTPVRCDGFG